MHWTIREAHLSDSHVGSLTPGGIGSVTFLTTNVIPFTPISEVTGRHDWNRLVGDPITICEHQLK